ncbi:REP element-mobilizing transposase RayT [Desulfatibacillum alkenivorans DSM 16219]|uniref:REP element-mobilizing transposase RayT n=1 Tax=Desulfatibacillum alkenivorans DSM 16219 TaxID=1121393 RepID=A0A1M6ICE8_9BACT|nr:transposase [Desulfatibacillum alkenivorans]SHJ32118.1 REP element-mobilizing transposase RayT [Desulfatibacillum alkenivorans DSM 16219]
MADRENKSYRHKSIRLKNYDYSRPGAYYITICTQDKACLLGQVVNRKTVPSDAGKMVRQIWEEIPSRYPGVRLDAFVLMPNHIHGIIILERKSSLQDCNQRGAESGRPQGYLAAMSLSDIVRRFKTLTTRKYIDGVNQLGWPRFNGKLWQQNFYDHIIRKEESLHSIREYIANNPAQWELDKYNPFSMNRKDNLPA